MRFRNIGTDSVIGLREISFGAAVDPMSTVNLICPCFFKEWKHLIKGTSVEERVSQEEYERMWKECWLTAPIYYDRDLYTTIGRKLVWRGWRPKLLKRIMLDFTFNDKKYSEEFLIDNTVCAYNRRYKANIVAILGKKFIIEK